MTHELRKLATRARDAKLKENWRDAMDDFRAAANPKNVLELLDRIAELEGAEQRGYDAAKEQAAKMAKVAWLQTQYGSIADADAMNGMCEELSAAIRAMVRP